VRFSELDGARVGVWGAGREIASFAAQLQRRLPAARIAVAAFDSPPAPAQARALLGAPEARVVDPGAAPAALAECDVLVRSPGVSIHRRELRELRDAGVPVTTATALWLAERGGHNTLGVTGTKGKSTTAALLAALLRAGGREAHLAGNIGAPVLELLDVPPEDAVVVELSSYQIADLALGPELALVTSLFREHLDWHGSEATYVHDKLRLLGLPGVRTAVVNARDERLRAAVGAGVECVPFGTPDGWDATARGIERAGELVLDAAELPLRGEHNALNLCGALAALEARGLQPPSLPGALRGFHPLPHRLEAIGERGGVLWIDDSISTTPESALAALASFPDRELVLIGGGQDRGQDHAALAGALAARGASVIALGETGPRLLAAARAAGVPAAALHEARDMEAAVGAARRIARPGAVVVLSPAAPSYDGYVNFEARGACFRRLVESSG
jgi:UDP-N-acetylmuramoylalanine--D-glutamate ligase